MGNSVDFIQAFNCNIEMPNGLQWFNNDLFVIDQKTDNVFILDIKGETKKDIPTICENGSGITVGDGFMWLGSNGRTDARSFRGTDTHMNWILKADIDSGEIISRFPTPDGGGVHGLEWDDGNLWITAFNPTALILVNSKSFEVIFKFDIDQSPHGLAIHNNGIWCSDRVDRNIVKYNKSTGEKLEQINVPDDGPDPHGLSINNGTLWYSDAAFPNPVRPYPEIGYIKI